MNEEHLNNNVVIGYSEDGRVVRVEVHNTPRRDFKP